MSHPPTSHGINRHEAAKVFGGSVRFLNRAVRAGILLPVAGSGPTEIYDSADVYAAWDKFKTQQKKGAKRK